MTVDIPSTAWLTLVAIAAATINGALGYGFSSVTVPLALLFTTSRVLNPALVLAEVPMNIYALMVNRRAASHIVPRVIPLVLGLVPGIAVGTAVLASIDTDVAKLITYAVLLPLILLQAGGLRRPFRSDAVSLPFGAGVGLLYSTTTISGPPIAAILNNQGFTKGEFRGALALIRTAESTMTAASYLLLGLHTTESLALIPWIMPAILIGIPLGAAATRRVNAETFRRVCMGFDAAIVSFGLARVLEQVGLARGLTGPMIVVAVVAIDLVLLGRYFAATRRGHGGTRVID